MCKADQMAVLKDWLNAFADAVRDTGKSSKECSNLTSRAASQANNFAEAEKWQMALQSKKGKEKTYYTWQKLEAEAEEAEAEEAEAEEAEAEAEAASNGSKLAAEKLAHFNCSAQLVGALAGNIALGYIAKLDREQMTRVKKAFAIANSRTLALAKECGQEYSKLPVPQPVKKTKAA
jgi:hypothetical protein